MLKLKSGIFWSVLLGKSLSVAIVSSCGGSLYSSATLKPGEADYPVSNKTPKDVVRLRVKVAQRLVAHIFATYRVSASRGGTMASGTSCQREIGWGVSAALTLRVPVELSPAGDGLVTVDSFEPGRCDWEFSDISYSVDGTNLDPQPLATFTRRDNQPVSGKVDIWCTRQRNMGTQTVSCAGLHMLSHDVPAIAPAEALAAETQVGDANDDNVSMSPMMQTMSITIHDLDAKEWVH